MGDNTLQNLEALGNAVKRAGEIAAESEQSEKNLQEVQKQLGIANSDLSFIKLEIDAESKKLAKIKTNASEAEEIEKAKLVEIQLKRAGAEKEYESFLARTAKERRELEEGKQKFQVDMEKLNERITTNQNVVNEKKAYIEEAKKAKAELDDKGARVNSDLGSFEKLADTMRNKEASVISREEGVKNQEQEIGRRASDLSASEARLKNFEGSLAAREANLVPLEAKLELKRQANEEKETHLIKYEESLKMKGYVPPAQVEQPKAEEPKADAPVSGKKDQPKKGKKK